ncbi:Retrovirus-related Pol poly from transposon [Paramuricea clavata]|uniref:Retrovirus-related Pol poly from transposon n=1 Tax=Paramuricea clavata TaxID=317549 RepID=A0A6S7KDZ3_PARCT|nr:Retrovirus-related Pol poly from transposon [Paramuricea clavata]
MATQWSRSLTETESRYAQIEKELLAVQFSLDRFHQYVYGKEVIVESDHKPLEMIAKKSLALAPPRLQRLLLRIQKYNYTIVYKSAKEMALPDMLSTAPLPETDEEMGKKTLKKTRKSQRMARSERESVPLSVLPYWNIRAELYFEVVKLPDTKSSTVITYTKSIFSQHGIPAEVVSDNGPQYSSREFEAFAGSWEFKHTTVSPLNPQVNCLAERTVQTIKDLLASPAQLLMNRGLRSRIPQTISQLKPRVPDPVAVKKKLNLKQQKQKFYYDRQSKSLTKLHERDIIRTDDGGKYRRNGRMLLKSVQPDPVAEGMFSGEIPSTRIRSIPSPENVEALVTPDATQS